MSQTIAEKIDGFFIQFKHQLYKKGEMLIRADDEPVGIYYLKKGNVKQYVISQKGDELVLNIYKPVAFFPMSWAVNTTENRYFFQALSDVEVWRAPKDDVLHFIKTNPDVMYDLISRLYRGMDGLLLRMSYLMSGSAYTRLITELLIQTKRFGTKTDKGAYELKITESDIGTSAGLTRETISREMRVLKEKNLVTLHKNVITIHDLDKLENELTTDR